MISDVDGEYVYLILFDMETNDGEKKLYIMGAFDHENRNIYIVGFPTVQDAHVFLSKLNETLKLSQFPKAMKALNPSLIEERLKDALNWYKYVIGESFDSQYICVANLRIPAMEISVDDLTLLRRVYIDIDIKG